MHTIFKVLAILMLSTSLAHAAKKEVAIDEKQIYSTTSPMNKEDETSVLVFFKFNCPVCRKYHAILERWGGTLPKQFIFQFIPVAEGDGVQPISTESGLGMLGFWSAEMSGNREQRAAFSEEMYGLYQDRHVKITPAEVISVAAESQIPMKAFEKAWRSQMPSSPGLARQVFYQPSVTPTMVVCGKYVITPDNALGNQDTFIQLANAMVSKCMVEEGMSN